MPGVEVYRGLYLLIALVFAIGVVRLYRSL